MCSVNTTKVNRPLGAFPQSCMWLLILVLSLMLFTPSVVRADQYGFCSIPAMKASKRSNVELRLGIKNETGIDRLYKVDFYHDTYSAKHKITKTPVSATVKAGKWGLFNISWNPILFSGSRTLLYEVKDWTQGDPGSTYAKRGSSPLTIIDSGSGIKAPSTAPAAWIEPGWLLGDTTNTRQQLIDRINEMHALGMDLIVIAYVEDIYGGGPGVGAYYTSSIPELANERHYDDAMWTGDTKYHVLDTILETAEHNGQKVALGLGRGPGVAELPEWITTDEHRKMHWDFLAKTADEVWGKYGRGGSVHDYNDTIWGWFLCHECGTFNLNAKGFFDGCCDILRKYDPSKPIIMSPCPVYNLNTPPFKSTYSDGSTFAANLAGSKIDIFLYQDGASMGFNFIGAIPDDCGVTYDSWIAICANAAFELQDLADKHAGTGKHFWSMMEEWRQGKDGNQWAGTWDQCHQQMYYERQHASQIVFNEYLAFMKSPSNNWSWMRSGSSDLYNNYKTWYDGNRDK